jgi:hypothetical protein
LIATHPQKTPISGQRLIPALTMLFFYISFMPVVIEEFLGKIETPLAWLGF